MKINTIIKSVAKVSFITMISRILGYVRDMLIAAQLGAGVLNDVFIASFKLTNLFRTLFGEGTFNITFVPMFSQLMVKKTNIENIENDDKVNKINKNAAIEFAINMQSFLISILVLFSIIMIIFMPLIMAITAPGFVEIPGIFDLSIKLSRIIFPYLIFISISAFYGGILASIGVFSPFAITSIILNIVMIMSVISYKSSSIFEGVLYNLSYGVIIAGIFELLWMLYFAKRYKLLIPLCWPKITPQVKIALKRMIPSIFGSSIAQINVWIDMLLVSFISGGMSYLYFADRIMQLPMALIGTSMGIVILPALSQAVKSNEKDKISEIMYNGFYMIMFFSLPSAAGLIMMSQDVVCLLFMHGKFNMESVYNTSMALVGFSIGLPAFSLNKLLVNMFYSHGDTKTPVKLSAIGIFINAGLSLMMLQALKHVGVALASSITIWVMICFMVIILKKNEWISIKYKEIIKELIKYATSTMIMVIYTILFDNILKIILINITVTTWYSLIIAFIKIISCFCIYMLSNYILKSKILSNIAHVMKDRKKYK